MILATFITALRASPVFKGRVAGAAEFRAGLKNYNVNMPLPAAYVVPLDQEAGDNEMLGPELYQQVTKSIGVIVEADASPDRRGQAPAMTIDDFEAAIFRCVLNLIVDPCRSSQGARFGGAQELDLDRARLFYQWQFSVPWVITDQDGVQPDPGIPLTGVELDIFKAPVSAGEPPAAVIMVNTSDADPPPVATDGPWPAEGSPP